MVDAAIDVKVNPHGRSPLGALLTFTTKDECQVHITVPGDQPITYLDEDYELSHELIVTGLYPGQENQIEITLVDRKGREYEGTLPITTLPLPEFLPTIEITTLDRSRMEPGLHLFEILIANQGKFNPYTIMFDDNGDIRWMMDMSEVEPFSFTPYRLKNGNWLYVSWVELYELDDLGQVVRHVRIKEYSGDHDVVELEDGGLIMGASKADTRILRENQEAISRYDFVIELDKDNWQVIREWDLRKVLDVDRAVFPKDFIRDFAADWFHFNSLALSQADNSLVISGRNQGVLKVDWDNNLKWILAPHRGWGKAGSHGNGLDTRDYLLTAVDRDGNPLPPDVQEGIAGTDDFEWCTGQHGPTILENGNLVIFDNGLSRNFGGTPTYSRAVEYQIDEEKRTIQQVWQYGKERGLEMFSGITSDVDVLNETGNRLVTAGNIRLSNDPPHAKMIEVSYPDNTVVFEAKINFKDGLGTKAQEWAQFDVVYRGERYPLRHR